MKKWYLILKAFGEYKPGTDEKPSKAELELNDETKGLLQGGFIKECTLSPEEEAMQGVVDAFAIKLEATADAIVRKALERATKGLAGIGKGTLFVGTDRELEHPNEGYDSLGDFARDMHRTHNGAELSKCPRLVAYKDVRERKVKAVSGQSESITEDGGLLLPTEISSIILKKAWDESDLLKRVQRYAVAGNALDFRTVVDDSRATGSRHGGVRSYWMDEAEQHAISKAKWQTLSLKLHKLGSYVAVTDELMEDAGIALDTFLADLVASEMNFVISDSFVNGNGSAKPLGILNAPCFYAVAKETSQVASTIVAENIDKVWLAMPVKNRMDAIWMINAECEPALQQLAYKVPIKNVALSENVGGGIIPLYVPPGGLSGSPYGTLKGRPVIPYEHNPGLGTVGDVIFASWKEYLCIVKGGIKSAASIHLRFDYGETTFRFTFRVDGQPWWRTTGTPFKTTTSRVVSPFVGIATRS